MRQATDISHHAADVYILAYIYIQINKKTKINY